MCSAMSATNAGTLTRMKQGFPSFGEAKATKPAVFQLLLNYPEVVEW
jgi:hypothetical protein